MAEGSKENLAYRAFRESYDSLLHVTAQPGLVVRLASRLYNKALISASTRDTVQLTLGLSPEQQAAILLNAVERSIRTKRRALC